MTSRTAPTLEAVLDNRVRGSNPGKRRRRESPHGRRSVRRHPNHSAVGTQVQGAQLGGHERGHVDGRHQRRRRRRRRGSTAPMVVQSVATTGRPPRPLTGGILVSEQTADAERESRLEIGSVLRHAHHLRRRQGRRRRARPAPVRRFGARHPGAVHRARLIILLLVPGLGSVRTFALDRSGQANAGSSEIGPLALACEDGADSGWGRTLPPPLDPASQLRWLRLYLRGLLPMEASLGCRLSSRLDEKEMAFSSTVVFERRRRFNNEVRLRKAFLRASIIFRAGSTLGADGFFRPLVRLGPALLHRLLLMTAGPTLH